MFHELLKIDARNIVEVLAHIRDLGRVWFQTLLCNDRSASIPCGGDYKWVRHRLAAQSFPFLYQALKVRHTEDFRDEEHLVLRRR